MSDDELYDSEVARCEALEAENARLKSENVRLQSVVAGFVPRADLWSSQGDPEAEARVAINTRRFGKEHAE